MNPVLDPFLHRLYTGAVDFRVLFWVGRFFNLVLLCLYTGAGAVDCRVRKGFDAPEPRRGTVPALASVVTRAPPTASRVAPAPLLAPTYLQSQQPAGCKNLSRRSPGLAFLRHPIITDSATRAEQIPLPGNEQPNCSSRLSDMTTSIRQRFDSQRDIILYELALGTRHRGAPVTRQALYSVI